jgi:hypothetical protein
VHQLADQAAAVTARREVPIGRGAGGGRQAALDEGRGGLVAQASDVG